MNTIDPRIMQAVRYLSGQDMDHATQDNGVGWNGSDSHYGHALAGKPDAAWTPKMAQAAYRMLRKYTKQLASAGIDYATITNPATVTATPRVATISAYKSGLAFRSSKDHAAVELVRNLPQRRWLGAPEYVWAIPLTAANVPTLRAMFKSGVAFDAEAVAKLRQLSQ